MSNVERILRSLWFTPGTGNRWGLPVIFQGEPGTAKSARIEAATARCGFYGDTVIASLRRPEDFLGLPFPVTSAEEQERLVAWMRSALPKAEPVAKDGAVSFGFGTLTAYSPPAWAAKAAMARQAVIFLDEINTAPGAVQAALLRAVLNNVVGELVLPPTVRWVAAMNAAEDAAGGNDLAPPLANRFGHLPWQPPSVDEFVGFLLGTTGADDFAAVDPEREQARVMKDWPEFFAGAAGAVAGFLHSKRDMMHKKPDSGSPNASGAWPSARTWEMAIRALAGARLHGLPETDQDLLVEAFVGAGAAVEFASYRRNTDLPDSVKLLDGKVKWKHNPDRIDRTLAVLSSCAAVVTQVPEHQRERAVALWKLIEGIVESDADICMQPATALARAKFGMQLPEAKKAMLALFPVVESAGVKS